MRLIRVGLAVASAAALAACTSVGKGSAGTALGHGSSAVDPAASTVAPPPACKPGETLVTLGGVPRCV